MATLCPQVTINAGLIACQVLLADSTASLLSGVDLLDVGQAAVAGCADARRDVSTTKAGITHRIFRALDTTPGNLWPATTSLIGRESAVGEITAAVRAHRVVTLTGVGGGGKTRLAVEIAGGLADDFPYGVWFFELAAVTDAAAVPDAVAAVLGIPQDRERIGGHRIGRSQPVIWYSTRKNSAGTVFGVRREIRPAKCLRRNEFR